MAEADVAGELLFLHADTIFSSRRSPTRAPSGRPLRTLLGWCPNANWPAGFGSCGTASMTKPTSGSSSHRRSHGPRSTFAWTPLVDWCCATTPTNRHPGAVVSGRSADGMLRAPPIAAAAGRQTGSEGERTASRCRTRCGRRRRVRRRALWFNAEIDVLGEEGIRRVVGGAPGRDRLMSDRFPRHPRRRRTGTGRRRGWSALPGGVNRLSVDWTLTRCAIWSTRSRSGLGGQRLRGARSRGVPRGGAAAPASVTADFNFPEWHYFGRGLARRRRTSIR